ncbi:MAG TPA: endonuclease MutS2 [Chloroflexota bacterium]
MIADKTLQMLEFPKVLAMLANHTSFSLSKELALALRPETDADEVLDLQARVREAGSVLDARADVSLGGARDIRPAVSRAQLGGSLDPTELLAVRGTLECAERIRGALNRLDAEEYPWLAALRARIGLFREILSLIAQTVSQQGEVLDTASAALGTIRAELRVAHQRLLERLQSILNSPTYRTAIQESIITIRNGRYVIPVRSDARGVIRGAVHDHSASGATLYVEPFQTNELNNRWRELQLREQEEIARILQFIAERIGAQGPAIQDTVLALGDLDLAMAKARFGAAQHGVLPAIAADGALSFELGRHPLLTGTVVPISVRLGSDFRVLLVTGPNTGGKTVALKTVGLLTLMAQSGLPIPAASGSRAAVFDGIFADIGDEQSIEQSLSTFSGHLSNIIRILKEMTPNSLLLLDELGAGTDPAEGSALARSLLTHLLETGARVMATTHYSELKAFAAATEEVRNASVEFDVETLSPTYKLSIGLPGRSNALAIAARLGLPADIIAGSHAFISAEEKRVETMLAEIERDREAAVALFQAARTAQQGAVDLRARLEREVREILREREVILRAARAEASASVDELRRELDRAEAELRLHGTVPPDLVGGLRERLAVAVAEQSPLLAAPAARKQAAKRPAQPVDVEAPRVPVVGDRVSLIRSGQIGTVVSAPNSRGEIEVQIGPFKTRVKAGEARVLDIEESGPSEEPRMEAARFRHEDTPAPSVDFDLRGWRVDEVLHELERYLNDAYMANLPFVRIIHGKGTGALRQAVREELATNPLVSNFRAAEARDGGEGVTVAHLAV